MTPAHDHYAGLPALALANDRVPADREEQRDFPVRGHRGHYHRERTFSSITLAAALRGHRREGYAAK